MSSRHQRVFLVGLLVAVSAVFLWMIRTFLIPLFLAATFASLSYPLFQRLERLLRGWRKTAAALTLLALLLGVAVPLAAFARVIAGEAVKVSTAVGRWVEGRVHEPEDLYESMRSLPGYEALRPHAQEILARVGAVAGRLGNFLVEKASAATAGTLVFFLHLGILLYAMFFFLVDGPAILQRILYLTPLTHEDEMRLLDGFSSMARATVKGTLVIGLIQGAGAGAALALAGVPSALFWSTVMVLFALVPVVGTPLIWIPASIYLYVQGEALKAALVVAWCAVFVGSVDNILRPYLVGRDTQVHDLLVLVSTLGGLMLFGMSGFIIGPVIAVLFLTVWDIYGMTFKDMLSASGQE